MRIIHVIDSAGVYGAEQVVLNLLTEQCIRGHESILASIAVLGEQPRPIEKECALRHVAWYRVAVGRGVNPFAPGQLARQIQNLNPDLVHTHGYKADVLMGLWRSRSTRPTTVSTVHGWTSVGSFSRNAMYERLQRAILPRLDAVVSVSGTLLRSGKLGKVQRAFVVPNGIPPLEGVELGDLDPELREFCMRAPTLVSVGRLSHEKDPATLVRAIQYCRLRGIGVQLLMLGDGYLRASLEDMVVGLRLQDVVRVAGYLSQPYRYFQHAVAYVLSSITEGMPITILEAMRAGVPIISTPVGDIPLAIGTTDYAWQFEPGNETMLAKAIEGLLINSRQAQREGLRLRQRWVHMFSSARMAEEYEAVYRWTLSRRSGLSTG